MIKERTKIWRAGTGSTSLVTSIPMTIVKLFGIRPTKDSGIKLEWTVDTKKNEIKIKIVKERK